MSALNLARSLHPRLGTARDLLAQPVDESEVFPATLEPLHRLLPEGLARGEIVEVVGHGSSGRFSLLLSLLEAVTRQGEAGALVDLGDHLDPQLAEQSGVCLDRLLWVRPPHLKPALAATEALLGGGFPFVALDLGTPPVPGGRGAQSSWLRLLAAVRSQRAVLLVSSPYRVSGTAATTVLEARQGRGAWRGSRPPQRLLRRLCSQMTLGKVRGRMPGASASLDLRLHTGGARLEPAAETDTATAAVTELPHLRAVP
ncbi:MAG: hypothetical protein R3190_03140 [Thermoanaerobaculia bacterium]|nr:hypothetical protein [Thermoanaerobaculia bacterium]